MLSELECVVPDRPRLKDGSEQVRRELAGIIDQLSCLRSESSKLTVTHDAPEILCHKLCLVSEHTGSSPANLKCSFLKPFLHLLKVDTPSSVKQGIWSSPPSLQNIHYSWKCTKLKYRN